MAKNTILGGRGQDIIYHGNTIFFKTTNWFCLQEGPMKEGIKTVLKSISPKVAEIWQK